jgi:glycosyltransferase involved in cell wall biosynthesis
MKVLHINAGNLYGGVETILVTLAHHRDLCPEMETQYGVCFDDRLSHELTEAGARVHLLGNVRASRPKTVLQGRRELAGVLRRDRFDLIVCHSAWPHAIFAPVARAAHKPLVFWLHNRVSGRHWSERWAHMTKPDLVLCVSRDTQETSRRIFPHTPSEVFYSPLRLQDTNFTEAGRKELRATLGTPVDATVIVQVSRLEAWKGHLLHLEALSALRDLPNWVCWQVGGAQRPSEAKYFAEIKNATERLGIAERVRFLGQRSDVAAILSAADIFCQPNLASEGFSISFMEAFNARLPIITTAIGGALEIVDETRGALVPLDDKPALIHALRGLIQDSSLRGRLGESGQRRLRQLCDPKTQMKKLHSIFTDLLSAT